jgi:hypothetical protein
MPQEAQWCCVPLKDLFEKCAQMDRFPEREARL